MLQVQLVFQVLMVAQVHQVRTVVVPTLAQPVDLVPQVVLDSQVLQVKMVSQADKVALVLKVTPVEMVPTDEMVDEADQ